MSLGYAEKLSYREDLGGVLGSPEVFDDAVDFDRNLDEFTRLVKESQRIVAFTGAGISTSCGIPDFRGPNGVWTMQRAGQPMPKPKVTFAAAKPSLTHQVLVALQNSGKMTYVVSQNVDGLHLRSGILRRNLAELHGNCFAERCSKCRREYVRDFEIETVGFRKTGRKCTVRSCRGVLKDQILDWEDALPEDELEESERQASKADLAICLGTSLKITPACNLPLRTLKAGGKLVIVNLQKTGKDKKASLVIHARLDDVMRALTQRLPLSTPIYRRQDCLTVGVSRRRASRSNAGDVTLSLDGREPELGFAPPLVASVTFKITEPSGIEAETVSEHPFRADVSIPPSTAFLRISFDVRFSEAADEDRRDIHFEEAFDISLLQNRGSDSSLWREKHFVTQVVDYHLQRNGGGTQTIEQEEQAAKRQRLEPMVACKREIR